MIRAATGFLDPGHPSPPGPIALMTFPCQQVPGHAARQLDERRRPRFPASLSQLQYAKLCSMSALVSKHCG